MAREKEGFREQLERLDAAFPGRETLRYKEISILFGYSQATAKRRWKPFYKANGGGVPKVMIAHELCK